MKTLCIVVGLACCIAGCVNKPKKALAGAGTEAPKAAGVTTQEHMRLKALVENLAIELSILESYLENDSKFLLHMMDCDLDAVERGENPRGSFSDYFVPNAAKALAAGAAKKDVAARIDRVVALAEKKIYLSDFVAELMDEGGAAAIRSYADASIQASRKR